MESLGTVQRIITKYFIRKVVKPSMETMLKVNGLNKSFKGKQVLHHISFEVKKAEIMAILGPNGAGKSTTIRSIMGIMYPDDGTITFQNQNGKEIPKNKIGRSEEHTSELQSRGHLVCRLLLEKVKNKS